MATTCMSSLLLLSCIENNDVQYLTGNIKGLLTEREVCSVKYQTEVF